MPHPTPTIQKILSTHSTPTSTSPAPQQSPLRVVFPSGPTISSPSTPATKQTTQLTPVFYLPPATLRAHPPGVRYIALAIDIDAPSPAFSPASPILHYLAADLVPAALSPFAPETMDPVTKVVSKEAWVPLEPDSTTTSNTATKTGKGGDELKPLATWLPPRPPGFSAAHRYVFVVWEQPERLSGAKLRAKLGMGSGNGNGEVGLWARMRWDVEGFLKKAGVREEGLVGATWMVVGA